MIFALSFLQCLSIAFGTVTTVYDIETVIGSYLSHTIDQHALHSTSYQYMQMVQQESNLTVQYLQSVRYILHGFPIRNSTTNDDGTFYKKLNFIQSIAYHYCDINMSDIMNTSLDNILIDESHLYMNSVIFPVQLVESYELIRSEICERIKLGLYQSIVDMFNPDMDVKSTQINPNVNADSFFSRFIGFVANFISCKTREYFCEFELDTISEMYPFLAKFGEFDLYKETVIDQIWHLDNSLTLESKLLDKAIDNDVDICVNQIKHPKMHKYVRGILQQQVKSTGNKSFILNRSNRINFRHFVQLYHISAGSLAINHQVENDTVQIRHVFHLLDECHQNHARRTKLSSTTVADCMLIAFGIYQSCQGDMYGHEYVVNAIKCIISNHDFYCSKFTTLSSGTGYEYFSSMFWKLRPDLRQSVSEVVVYPYLNELINDTRFVNIVNNNTNSKMDMYLQTILSKLMALALEEYKDIEMIKKIATVFAPKINVCRNGKLCSKYGDDSMMMSWMDVLIKHECMYLTKYFQQRFWHQIDHCSSKTWSQV